MLTQEEHDLSVRSKFHQEQVLIKMQSQMTWTHCTDLISKEVTQMNQSPNTIYSYESTHLYGEPGEDDVFPPGDGEHTSHRGTWLEGEDLCQTKSDDEHESSSKSLLHRKHTILSLFTDLWSSVFTRSENFFVTYDNCHCQSHFCKLVSSTWDLHNSLGKRQDTKRCCKNLSTT